jgi:hypothetical protein
MNVGYSKFIREDTYHSTSDSDIVHNPYTPCFINSFFHFLECYEKNLRVSFGNFNNIDSEFHFLKYLDYYHSDDVHCNNYLIPSFSKQIRIGGEFEYLKSHIPSSSLNPSFSTSSSTCEVVDQDFNSSFFLPPSISFVVIDFIIYLLDLFLSPMINNHHIVSSSLGFSVGIVNNFIFTYLEEKELESLFPEGLKEFHNEINKNKKPSNHLMDVSQNSNSLLYHQLSTTLSSCSSLFCTFIYESSFLSSSSLNSSIILLFLFVFLLSFFFFFILFLSL